MREVDDRKSNVTYGSDGVRIVCVIGAAEGSWAEGVTIVMDES